MGSDCYQKFRSVYSQAIADGLTTAAAIAAAQSAMDACLAQQNSKPSTVAQPIVTVKSGRRVDEGPTRPPSKS